MLQIVQRAHVSKLKGNSTPAKLVGLMLVNYRVTDSTTTKSLMLENTG